jgi:hypothetical protein
MSAKGKISRLPFEIRKELNSRIRDGVPDVDILTWLNGLPEVRKTLEACDFGGGKEHRPEISSQNVSEYRRAGGPYEEWLAGEADVERMRRSTEMALRLAETSGGMVSKPLIAILAGKIDQAMDGASDEERSGLAKALTAVAGAEADMYRAMTDRERLQVQKTSMDLQRRKFRYAVCRDALRLFEDERARAIAEGKGGREEKIQQLLTFMEKAEKED